MSSVIVMNIGKTRCAAGIDCVSLLPGELEAMAVHCPMIVTDENISKLEKFRKTVDLLEKSGFRVTIYTGITPDPKDYEVMAAAACYREAGCDCVIGIGGGSSMDCAKCVAAMVRHDGDIMQYGRSSPNRRFFTKGREPLICIPTTTGTGSEMSPHAVITNTKRNNRKSDVQSSIFYNDLFFLDPEFACTQPYETIRDTGVDALSHMIDSYTNRTMLHTDSPIHEAMGLKCCQLIGQYFVRAIRSKGADLEAVLGMQWAAALGGAMLDLNGAAMHGLSGMLQKYRHGMTHGVSVGLIMPACMEYNLSTDYSKFAAIAQALGADISGMDVETAAKQSVREVNRLLNEIGFPCFSDYHFTEDEIREMAEASVGNSMLPFNPRDITTAEQIISIYYGANNRIV